MKVALATIHRRPAFVPLALWYLESHLVTHAGLERRDVVVREYSEQWTERHIVHDLLQVDADLVGFSCYVWNITTTLAAAALLKVVRPSTTIVLGGPEVGPRAADVLVENPFVDAVVDGEGELTFADVVARLQRGERDLSGIPGLTTWSGGAVQPGAPRPQIANLDEIASPYLGFDRDLRDRVVCLETQRGCVFSCNFCYYSKGLAPASRQYSMSRVTAEIDDVVARGPRGLYLMDPVFNLRPARAKAITEHIVAVKPPSITVQTEIWGEFVDAELAQVMSRANFSCLEVGLQSTDEAVLSSSDRRSRVDRLLRGVGILTAHGLPVELHLILGLPGDTRSTFLASLDVALKAKTRYLGVFPLLLLPGTKLRDEAAALGLRYQPAPPYTVISTPDLPASEILELERVGRAVVRMAQLDSVHHVRRDVPLDLAAVARHWIETTAATGPQRWHDASARAALRDRLETAIDDPQARCFYRPMLGRDLGGG